MAMTGSESVVSLQSPFGRCSQLASAASRPATRGDDKQFEVSQRMAGADDGTGSPVPQEISFGADMRAPLGFESRTRFFGMSPGGEIASPYR